MRKSLVIAALLALLVASPASAAISSSMTISPAGPYHYGDTIVVDATLTGGSSGASSSIWLYCFQPTFVSNKVLDVRAPFGSSFTLSSPTWDPSALAYSDGAHAYVNAECNVMIVYTTTYGRDKVRNSYLNETYLPIF
jgi:hypothetical protein